jgi:acetolactate synthase-1/2/3 large subunit
MAEGSWLSTGAPGLLVATVGPGLTNAVNAVANAHLDRVPLIVLSGAAEGRFTHQVLDQRAVLTPLVKASFAVTAENAAGVIARALQLAAAHPRGPVHLDLAPSVASAPAELGEGAGMDEAGDRRCIRASDAAERSLHEIDRLAALGPLDGVAGGALGGHAGHVAAASDVGSAAVDLARIRLAADWLAVAERPLVIAGLEANHPRVAAALAALLDRYRAPLLTTYKAKGVVSEHDPRCIGAISLSPRADALVAPLIQQADVVLLVGYDPVEMRASYVDPFAPGTRVIELAAAPREHGMHLAQLELAGDLAPSLTALGRELSRSGNELLWPDGEPARVRERLHAAFAPAAHGGFSPLDVAQVLAEALPEDVQLTLDTGAHRIVTSQVPIARRAGHVAQSNGLCTMGYALPAAIGWSLASGGRRAVAVMGDGGLEMVLGELATLRDLALPITLVVFDDRSLALIDMKQRASGYSTSGVWLGATDHVALARAFGGQGERVSDRAGFAQALRAALEKPRGFSLISCALERGAYAALI